MPTPMQSSANPDVMDRRFSKIFVDRWNQLPSKKSDLYQVKQGRKGPDERTSQFGAFGNFVEFSGSVNYQSAYQGYDVTATYKHFASGFQVDVTYAEDDLFNVVDGYPAKLATAAKRTQETHAARLLVLAFSVDTDFYNHSEGVALCSNSHTTTATGTSTASGFDNLTTSGLSMTSMIAARTQMRGFRDDRGNRIDVEPNQLWIPPDLASNAYELVQSMGRPDNANNALNYFKGKFTIHEWNYLSDANDWYIMDDVMMKDSFHWYDRIPIEFARAEDLDTIVMKWRGRMRYTYDWQDWRCILGAQVS